MSGESKDKRTIELIFALACWAIAIASLARLVVVNQLELLPLLGASYGGTLGFFFLLSWSQRPKVKK